MNCRRAVIWIELAMSWSNAQNRGFWIDQMPLHFDRRGPPCGASSILSNTTDVIQGTTHPKSLIYFFMQITIQAISSSENKNIGLNPVLNSSEWFQSPAAISSHFFIFFTWLRWETYGAPPPTGAATEGDTWGSQWHDETVTRSVLTRSQSVTWLRSWHWHDQCSVSQTPGTVAVTWLR